MDKIKTRKIALASGLALKLQADGSRDLNEYIYEFAKNIETYQLDIIAEMVNDHWCMTEDGEATKRHVINSILSNIQEMKDKAVKENDDG